jgi:hypothetical protein
MEQEGNMMDIHTATEQAYKNGYARGFADGKGEWISVEEVMPDSGEHCLLACKVTCYNGANYTYVCDGFHVDRWKEQEFYNGSGDQAIEYNEDDDEYYLCEGWYEIIKNWDEYNSVAIDDTVTHWMHLPEPPKGE